MSLFTQATQQQPNFAELYERVVVPKLFRPFAAVLLDRVGLTPGDRVLDIACGTGIVARLAAERLGGQGSVVGVDLNPQMLGVATSLAPGIDWREGDAGALPIGEHEQFDVVTCHQGVQFFSDREAAAQEMRRALAPHGRLVVAAWRAVEEMPLFHDLQRLAELHVGPIVDTRHGFGDASELQKLLVDAGLHDVTVEDLWRTIRFEDPSLFARMNTMAIVGMSAAAATMDEAKRGEVTAAIIQESAAVLADYVDDEGLAFQIGTNVATARG